MSYSKEKNTIKLVPTFFLASIIFTKEWDTIANKVLTVIPKTFQILCGPIPLVNKKVESKIVSDNVVASIKSNFMPSLSMFFVPGKNSYLIIFISRLSTTSE